MKSFFRLSLIAALIIGGAAFIFGPAIGSALAARGAPGSPDFGFGAVLYPDGAHVKEALAAASDLNLDWISVPVNWAAVQPDQAALNLSTLDPVMQYAAEHDIAVMLSLSQPPAWALTPQGPSQAQTAQFLALLAKRYPALQAVELFPGANTVRGWAAKPDPAAYSALMKAVSSQLKANQSAVLMVAAGLQPVPAVSAGADMDDLTFLRGLYQADLAGITPVVSIQYPELEDDPFAMPSSAEPRVLRHYEDVRRVMVENRNATGMIWVTRIGVFRSKINVPDSVNQNQTSQAEWLSQGYAQLRAQLYMGVGFLQSLNSNQGEGAALETCLLSASGGSHPFYPVLRDMIALNKAGSSALIPGKAKGGNLEKKRP